MFAALAEVDGTWIYRHVVFCFDDGERADEVERDGE